MMQRVIENDNDVARLEEYFMNYPVFELLSDKNGRYVADEECRYWAKLRQTWFDVAFPVNRSLKNDIMSNWLHLINKEEEAKQNQLRINQLYQSEQRIPNGPVSNIYTGGADIVISSTSITKPAKKNVQFGKINDDNRHSTNTQHKSKTKKSKWNSLWEKHEARQSDKGSDFEQRRRAIECGEAKVPKYTEKDYELEDKKESVSVASKWQAILQHKVLVPLGKANQDQSNVMQPPENTIEEADQKPVAPLVVSNTHTDIARSQMHNETGNQKVTPRPILKKSAYKSQEEIRSITHQILNQNEAPTKRESFDLKFNRDCNMVENISLHWKPQQRSRFEPPNDNIVLQQPGSDYIRHKFPVREKNFKENQESASNTAGNWAITTRVEIDDSEFEEIDLNDDNPREEETPHNTDRKAGNSPEAKWKPHLKLKIDRNSPQMLNHLVHQNRKPRTVQANTNNNQNGLNRKQTNDISKSIWPAKLTWSRKSWKIKEKMEHILRNKI